jgi:tRNA nucleotidyltransferase/poly(A) polymerase
MREPVEKIFVEMPIPQEVLDLHAAIKVAGGRLLVVGGSVRDFWSSIEHGKPFKPKDFDLVTEMHPDQVLSILSKAKHLRGVRFREVGKAFGVVLVTYKGKDYEIATFREDAKTGDGRRPDHVTFSTIDKDAERRDLTINALYYDLEEKCIIDFFGGISDIRSKRVRFVGDVLARIHEDKLRVMRFVRFHCRVNPGRTSSVDKDTMEVIQQVKLRPEISDERIREEFIKGLESAIDIRNYLFIMDDLGLLEQCFPDLRVCTRLIQDGGLLPHGVSSVPPGREPESLLAQILRYNDPGKVREALLALKYTAQEATDVSFLMRIPQWKEEGQFVDFKKFHKRTSLKDEVIERHITLVGEPIVSEMLLAPYPTVKGEVVMAETGLQGKALGDEMLRRELENFKAWRNQAT